MKFKELTKFTIRHFKTDSKLAFISRMVRFGLLSVPVMIGEIKVHKYRNDGAVIKNVWDNKMLLNLSDKGINTDLWLSDKREPLICTKFRQMLRNGMVVYDIGANIGYYALQEARIVGKSGYVYAIEPIPENTQALSVNIKLNNFNNIEIHGIAIGEEPHEGRINVSGMSNLSTMLDKSGYRDYGDSIPVNVESVDSFMVGKKPPDVIRMDTEGYETNIIKGMGKLLVSGRPLILFIEIHFDMLRHSVIPMLQTLKNFGFKIKWASHETHPIINNSWIKPFVNLCEKGMGASGYLKVSIDDLIAQEKFLSGQVENLEVIFERK
jgi:FkbM family methyltransferase